MASVARAGLRDAAPSLAHQRLDRGAWYFVIPVVVGSVDRRHQGRRVERRSPVSSSTTTATSRPTRRSTSARRRIGRRSASTSSSCCWWRASWRVWTRRASRPSAVARRRTTSRSSPNIWSATAPWTNSSRPSCPRSTPSSRFPASHLLVLDEGVLKVVASAGEPLTEEELTRLDPHSGSADQHRHRHRTSPGELRTIALSASGRRRRHTRPTRSADVEERPRRPQYLRQRRGAGARARATARTGPALETARRGRPISPEPDGRGVPRPAHAAGDHQSRLLDAGQSLGLAVAGRTARAVQPHRGRVGSTHATRVRISSTSRRIEAGVFTVHPTPTVGSRSRPRGRQRDGADDGRAPRRLDRPRVAAGGQRRPAVDRPGPDQSARQRDSTLPRGRRDHRRGETRLATA